MDRKKLLAGAAAVTILTLGGGIAYAADDATERATGPDAEKAKNAALDRTNGGRVTETEVRDEEGYYEVEVTRDDGTEVEVHLDRDLNVLSAQPDDDGPDDRDEPDNDPDDDGPGDD